MDEVEVKTKKIEIEVNQEKIDYINYVYNKESFKWEQRKRIARCIAFKNFVNS